MPSLKHRDGQVMDAPDGQDKLLAKLYTSAWGRALLRPLVSPIVSKAAGWFLSTRLSKGLIKPFIRANGIDMSQFPEEDYASYNAFFSRKIRPELRPIPMDEAVLIAPCDSKLTVLPVTREGIFTLKNTQYTVTSLLQDEALARKYEGGLALIFRLTVDDYHRYCYIADGEKTGNIHIPGVLHTVNPIANDVYPIYVQNSREYSLLHTVAFGDVLMMEVGALLVGKIVNHHGEAHVQRGQEKGYFQFGGSTVVLLLEKDRVQVDEDILVNSREGYETIVKMGEKIGLRKA